MRTQFLSLTTHPSAARWIQASPSNRKEKRLTPHRITSELRLTRLALATGLVIVLGWIIALAPPTSAQSTLEQFPSTSEETKDAFAAGKDPVANPISTYPIKDKAEATNQAGADSWGLVPTEKASLVNLAPFLLRYLNNGPVFGVPGTDVTPRLTPAHRSSLAKLPSRIRCSLPFAFSGFPMASRVHCSRALGSTEGLKEVEE